MVTWTKQQQKAIGLRDKNILVSAAAGSGKTAVLVERIKQLILRDKIPLDQFLIVTFTNAAAAEMKEKLVKAITKAIKDDPSHSSFLRKQLDLAANANISTFHSFALEVIRRYFYLIDVEPDFKIGDEGAIEIIKWDVMDQMFADRFEMEDKRFLDFLRAYASDRNERALKETILRLYTTIQSIPHPLQWLTDHVEAMNMDREHFSQSALADFIREDLIFSAEQIIEGFQRAGDLAENAGVESVWKKNQEDLERLEPLRNLARQGDLEGARRLLSSFKPNTMRAPKEEKEDYDLIKEEMKNARDFSKKRISDLKERYFSQELDTYLADLRSVYPAACFLRELIVEFDRRFRSAKQEKKMIDFNDIEHYALDILEHEEAADEYREKFTCIFVDEYQDSNMLQDTLINRIKRENNLFLVGDIKQSIYKFRLAEPEIFQARYEEYASGEEENSVKLDLNRNFRSKKSVIQTVNEVFSQIMRGYDETAALYQGVSYEGPIDYRTQIHVVDSRITEEMDLDEEVAEMKNSELEAFQAAEIIKSLIGKPIFDVKKNCERPIEKKDIVILMRGTKNYADVFQEIFTQMDLPCYVDDSSGYFDTVEIQVFLNLLRLIDNKQQDVPLLSALRSQIFGFSIEELIRIRLQDKRGSYYEAFRQCSLRGEDPLALKCRAAFEKLEIWRKMTQALPLEEFIWNLMWETGYYTYCGALPAGRQRQANLRALADKARDFKQSGYGGIYGFLTYIQALENRRIPTGQVKLINENDDLVRIMTIHKSKGLEFPVVIVAGLGKRFNFNKAGKGFLAHKDLGIGMTRNDYRGHWYRKTLMQTAIERKMRQEDLEEEIRILYVAFTRAKDYLILLGASKNVKDGEVQPSRAKNSFFDYLIPFIGEELELFLHDRGEMTLENRKKGRNREVVRTLLSEPPAKATDPIGQEIDRRLSFQYANEKALLRKSKYSVTELNRIGEEKRNEERSLRVPAFMQESAELTAAQRGTIMHKVMECLDFKEAFQQIEEGRGKSYIQERVRFMVEQELLLPQEAETVETDRIEAFFKSSVGARAAAADKVYKETEFNLLKELDGTEIMVQGIIDCYFEEGGKLILIDYKNSYVNPKDKEMALNRLRETYKGQIQIYKEALEVIRKKPVVEAYLYLFSEDLFFSMGQTLEAEN